MLRKIVLFFLLMSLASSGFCQYRHWTNYCNSSQVRELAFTATDIWCLAGSPLRIDRASGEITQLTHANVPLVENRNIAMATDPDGNLWFLPDSGGLQKFDGINWTLYQPDFDYYGFTSLAVASANDIWVGSHHGLVHFDGANFTNLDSGQDADSESIHQVSLDKLGRVWFWAMFGEGTFYWEALIRYDGEDFAFYFDLPDDSVERDQIVFDADNRLWTGTSYGLARFTGWNASGWVYLNTQNSGLLNNKVSCLGFDAAGTLWAGTAAGISSFDGTNWTNYTSQNSDWGDRKPLALRIADDQTLWLGTSDGLVKIADGILSSIDSSLQGFPSGQGWMQAQAPNGDWWFAFQDGLYVLTGATWTKIELPVVGFYPSDLLFDANGGLWLCSDYGLLRINGDNWTHFRAENSGLPSNNCLSMTLDSAGCLWIGTNAGVACYDGASWQVYDESNAPFPTNAANVLRTDPNGRIWVSNNAPFPFNPDNVLRTDPDCRTWVSYHDEMNYEISWGGAAMWDGQDWSYVDVPDFGEFTAFIADIDFWGDTVYFSTGGGLARLEAGEWTLYNTVNSGIPIAWINSADTDSFGNLWLASSYSGIARFDGTTWRSYRVANSGLAHDQYSQYLLVDAQDQVWVGG